MDDELPVPQLLAIMIVVMVGVVLLVLFADPKLAAAGLLTLSLAGGAALGWVLSPDGDFEEWLERLERAEHDPAKGSEAG